MNLVVGIPSASEFGCRVWLSGRDWNFAGSAAVNIRPPGLPGSRGKPPTPSQALYLTKRKMSLSAPACRGNPLTAYRTLQKIEDTPNRTGKGWTDGVITILAPRFAGYRYKASESGASRKCWNFSTNCATCRPSARAW